MLRANLTAAYTIQVEEVPVPEITEDQILLQVESFGICGSDIQMYHGLHKYMTYPVVIGHEACARIAQVGKNVSGFSVGERVTVEPQVYCGQCYPCQIGRFNVCEHLKVMGVHQNGLACQYFAIDPKYLHKCPESLSTQQITIVEPLAVGVGSVKRIHGLQGKNVVVVGAGTIGNLTAQAAQALGAGQVMITDIFEPKLELARACGIQHVVNTAEKSLKEAIVEHFGVQKADAIIDCAASKSSFESILDAARPSSEIIITGNYKAPMTLELPVIQRQEISMIGHMMYVREDFRDAIQMLADGTVHMEELVSAQFPIDQIQAAFDYIEEHSQTVMKVMMTL